MMRILTVKQPWASLLILGFKPVENRSWGTEYRGDVGIIAGKNCDISEWACQMFWQHIGPTLEPKPKEGTPIPDLIHRMPRGGIIGVMELYDITRHMESDWFCGPVGLLLRKPQQTKDNDGVPRLLSMPGNLSMFEAHKDDEVIIRSYL